MSVGCIGFILCCFSGFLVFFTRSLRYLCASCCSKHNYRKNILTKPITWYLILNDFFFIIDQRRASATSNVSENDTSHINSNLSNTQLNVRRHIDHICVISNPSIYSVDNSGNNNAQSTKLPSYNEIFNIDNKRKASKKGIKENETNISTCFSLEPIVYEESLPSYNDAFVSANPTNSMSNKNKPAA
jgi:hypothetical protein